MLEKRAEAVYAAAEAWPVGDGGVGTLLNTPPTPRKWFVRERLIAGRAHLLTGIGGASKSTLLYHLAIGGVLGRLPWNWDIEGTGTGLLFLTEDVASDVHETLAAMTAGLSDIDRAKLSQKLRIWPLAGQDARLLSLDGQTIYINERGLALIETCKQFQDVAFIGLDPALGLTEGDEMSQSHQRSLGQYADRLAIETGACVVLVSHATKASASAEELTSHQSRGGGGITDAVRGEFVLRTMTAKEAKTYGIDDLAERKRHVQLIATKGNRIPPEAFVPLWLRRGPGGTLSEVELTEKSSGSKATFSDMKVLDVLRDMCRTSTPMMAEWRDECAGRGLVQGKGEAARKNMGRIRDRLLNDGLIEPALRRGAYVPASIHEGEDE